MESSLISFKLYIEFYILYWLNCEHILLNLPVNLFQIRWHLPFMLYVDIFPNMIYYQVIFKASPGPDVLVKYNNISCLQSKGIRTQWPWEGGRHRIQGLCACASLGAVLPCVPGKGRETFLSEGAPLVYSPQPGSLISGEANLKVFLPNLGVRVEP